MNKNELIKEIAQEAELTKKDAENALNAFIKTVENEMKKGNKIQLLGFGTFEPSIRKEREGKNPKTKEKIIIPAVRTVKFKVGKPLKDSLNS